MYEKEIQVYLDREKQRKRQAKIYKRWKKHKNFRTLIGRIRFLIKTHLGGK